MRAALFATLAAGLAIAGPVHASLPGDVDLEFRVLLGEKDIGRHSFRVTGDGERAVVDIDADFEVTFLAIPVYRYRHTNREVWRDGCLASIASRTDDNGELQSLEGEVGEDSFVLRTRNGSRDLEAGCVMTFAYWNPDFLNRTALLNAQTGDYVAVDVERAGLDDLRLEKSRFRAERYRLSNADEGIDISLWYEADTRRWLALESRVDGKVIRYVPVRPASIAGTERAGAR